MGDCGCNQAKTRKHYEGCATRRVAGFAAYVLHDSYPADERKDPNRKENGLHAGLQFWLPQYHHIIPEMFQADSQYRAIRAH
jgi:hypothetical protein